MDQRLTTLAPVKPLGGKAYGSIPHLPGSRMGPGDHHCHEGQSVICTEKARKGDRVIVTEKLDGACMAVARIGEHIVPVTRAGYHAADGSYDHLRAFAPFVVECEGAFRAMLHDGERVCGEWLAMAHGTLYDPERPEFTPFVAFDLIRDGKRVCRDEFVERCASVALPTAACIHDEPWALSIDDALSRIGGFGFHGAVTPPEGAVWRVEREGCVDFLAKYVRPDKVDGAYLPNISGKPPVWHYGGEA